MMSINKASISGKTPHLHCVWSFTTIQRQVDQDIDFGLSKVKQALVT